MQCIIPHNVNCEHSYWITHTNIKKYAHESQLHAYKVLRPLYVAQTFRSDARGTQIRQTKQVTDFWTQLVLLAWP